MGGSRIGGIVVEAIPARVCRTLAECLAEPRGELELDLLLRARQIEQTWFRDEP
jgi:hypothetical protein